MKFVLIGAGQRGMIYAKYALEMGHEIAAVAETDEVKRQIAGDLFGNITIMNPRATIAAETR